MAAKVIARGSQVLSQGDSGTLALHCSPKLGLANALFFLQQYDEADGLVKKALAKDPKNPRGLLLRADLLRARGKSPEAKRAYERVVKVVPKSRSAMMAKKILAEW